VQGNKLTMNIGYSSPVVFATPQGITVAVKESIISVSGADKQVVGDVAARIRSFYPPEPYKGKGIRYKGEHVKRKTGKTVA
jgi:large subunit ribosomal protein L6